ncbi:MAG: alpha-N-arabinofuranosidase [Candidatus Poriferisodalaceae bacterium]|jgi:alpha-N-arabinofuranosidase
MRYPGGNFVSNYHWTDGVGPVDERPTVQELAWGTIEPNTFGTDEFLALAARMGWSPMLAVNLGSGSPEEAADWVEYCNAITPTKFAEMRRANGHDEPWAVPLWCLGNEMDGPWQIGHIPAREYGIKAQQAAHQIRLVDGSVELVVCGTSIPTNSTWMEWDRESLEAVGGLANYLSVHRYVGNPEGDTAAYLTMCVQIDRQIDDIDAVCRYVAGKSKSRRRPYIAFDEWNVWFKTMTADDMRRGQDFPMPLIEEVYDLQDALVVAQFLNSFIRHAHVVKVANLAQIVNVIAPMITKGDELLLQTIFHALCMFRHRRSGTSLRIGYDGSMVEWPCGSSVEAIHASAIVDGDTLHINAVNRRVDGPVTLTVALGDRAIAGLADGNDSITTTRWRPTRGMPQMLSSPRPSTT